jgi:hypothetical protein
MSLKPYGVQYNPGTPAGPKISVKDLERLGIRYVRVTWVDLINNIRYRILPLSYFKRLLESDRPGISVTSVVFGLITLQVADGFAPIGEYLYVPDLNTLRVCPYAEGHASIYGWFQEKIPPPNGTLEAELCPRSLLKKTLECVYLYVILVTILDIIAILNVGTHATDGIPLEMRLWPGIHSLLEQRPSSSFSSRSSQT